MTAAGTVLLLALAALGDVAQIRFVVFEIHHKGQGSLTKGKAQCGDLLVLTSLDLLLFKLEILFTYVTIQVTHLYSALPFQLVFPVQGNQGK